MAAPVVESIPTETELAVRILLVDDQPANLVALKAILEGISPHIVMARSGREARTQLLLGDLGGMLRVVTLRDRDGFESATLIRARERSRDTPNILLTAADRDAE
jgi:CheY-like chemotaxis protein